MAEILWLSSSWFTIDSAFITLSSVICCSILKFGIFWFKFDKWFACSFFIWQIFFWRLLFIFSFDSDTFFRSLIIFSFWSKLFSTLFKVLSFLLIKLSSLAIRSFGSSSIFFEHLLHNWSFSNSVWSKIGTFDFWFLFSMDSNLFCKSSSCFSKYKILFFSSLFLFCSSFRFTLSFSFSIVFSNIIKSSHSCFLFLKASISIFKFLFEVFDSSKIIYTFLFSSI